MSSYPPYNNDNPYSSSTQYPSQPGYYPTDQPPQYGYQPQPAPAYQAQVYAQPYMAVPVVPVEDPGAGAALTGMILGIIGLFFPIVGIGGLIFSIIGMRSITRKGMAIAGLVMSILSVLAMIAFAVIFLIILVAANGASSATGTY